MMKSNLTSLRYSIKQNLELIRDFQELIELEEKSVTEENTEPVDITYFKKFNTIQLAALETCQQLLDKHEAALKEEETRQAEARKQATAQSAKERRATTGAVEKTANVKKREIAEAIDLFADFENSAEAPEEEGSDDQNIAEEATEETSATGITV